MEKYFNITGPCIPEDHYMVDITQKLEAIKKMIDRKFYFTINRGRQYGKTTTLTALESYLKEDYTVISISFQGFGDASFESERQFCQDFLQTVAHYLSLSGQDDGWLNENITTFSGLSRHLTKLCKGKSYVLMIDEVDQASNHRVFLNFLGILRDKFILRSKRQDFTFHSVILVGVYDIKNIKLKMIQQGTHTIAEGERQYNSPWNIATQFNVNMAFSVEEIISMLKDYEQEHQTGMDFSEIATEIDSYTNGYPVLVSALCRYIHEELDKRWTKEGVQEAVRRLVRETDNELFKSLSQNLENNDEVRDLLYGVLILGARRSFSALNPSVDLAYRYGYVQQISERTQISNRIFEIAMTNYFISKEESKLTDGYASEITRGGRFNMELCLKRFAIFWNEIYADKEEKFLEKHCRLIFLAYLRPILNGVGFSFIETTFSDDRRMDLVVIYHQERFILELKTWKGQLYNEKGVEQLLGYMQKSNESKGYLLTFDFRKEPETFESKWREEGSSQVFEVRI